MDTFTESGFTTINLCLTKNDGVILILSALSVFRALYQSIFDLFSGLSIYLDLNLKVTYPGSVLRA